MTLLNVERIKLFSTKSPYWCVLTILAIGILVATLFGINASDRDITVSATQLWSNFGLMVAMVMSALAVTTEYRFGTIRNSFLAVPKSAKVLVSKTVLLALMSALLGVITSLIAYLIVLFVSGNPNGQLDINSAADWRILVGNALTFALASVISVAIGTLIRQSAGAIAILLLWPLIVENLFNLFGDFGQKLALWLPFAAGSRFTQSDQMEFGGENVINGSAPNWLEGILVFGATAVVLWIIALTVLKRRDA